MWALGPDFLSLVEYAPPPGKNVSDSPLAYNGGYGSMNQQYYEDWCPVVMVFAILRGSFIVEATQKLLQPKLALLPKWLPHWWLYSKQYLHLHGCCLCFRLVSSSSLRSEWA